MKYEPTGRTFPGVEEPETTGFVMDRDGDLWQRCRDENWECVREYRHAGPPRIGGHSWASVRGYGPLTELTPPPGPWD